MWFTKLSTPVSGFILLIFTGGVASFSSAIARSNLPEIHPSSVGSDRISQAIESERSGASQPTDFRTWSEVFDILKQKEEEEIPEISRSEDDELCIVSPGFFADSQVWYSTPFFIWQGTLQQIEVISRDTDRTAWLSEDLSNQTSILYEGNLLVPDTLYEIFIDYNAKQPMRFFLEVLDDESKQEIDRQLQIVSERMANTDPETISQSRINVFIKNNLFSEVLKELFRVENPSNELMDVRARTIQMLCEEDENDADRSEDLSQDRQ